jgi:hypothetical protein
MQRYEYNYKYLLEAARDFELDTKDLEKIWDAENDRFSDAYTPEENANWNSHQRCRGRERFARQAYGRQCVLDFGTRAGARQPAKRQRPQTQHPGTTPRLPRGRKQVDFLYKKNSANEFDLHF